MSDVKWHEAAQKHAFVISILLVILLGLGTVGCTELTAELDMPAPRATPEPWRSVRADTGRVATPNVTESALAELVAGNSAFVFDLYQAIRTEPGNLFYSPYSISVALAMTYAGARGATEEQMADTLHYTLPQDDLHPAFNALQQKLASRSEKTGDEGKPLFQLNIADAIWGQVGFSFREAYLNTLAQNYDAGLRLLDFAGQPERARAIINDWVSDATGGKIQDLAPADAIRPTTRLVLTNAIYLNALWELPFQKSQTKDAPFTLLDGRQATVPMMHETKTYAYAEGDGWQAIELPYLGVPVSMIVLLPAEGRFEAFEQSLNVERVRAILDQLESQGVELSMPKFAYESTFDLTTTLSEMGMPAAFSPAEADFSGITGDRSLFISDMRHKAFVSVDEKGTEAAAATMVAMSVSGVRDIVEMTIDRPFVFLIRDKETGTILFLGRVVDPSA